MDENYKNIEKKVLELFNAYCPELKQDFVETKLEFIGINSIDFVKIVVDLEEYFEFEFDDEDLDYKKFEYIIFVIIFEILLKQSKMILK